MSDFFDQLDNKHIEFIRDQHLFFVGTAVADGRVNVSPKGVDSLRVLDPSTVLWMNLTGSGNETAGHILINPRMTMMFCSFDRQPLILRLYGQAVAIHEYDEEWANCTAQFSSQTGARQFYRLAIDQVQTSCGYAVPFYDYGGEREALIKFADKKGRDGIRDYWAEKNVETIDGMPTKVLGDN
ncbi:MAG: hypothetical protein ACI9GW_002519 [Halieaceae bacterium]|jgi:hypothetical protein